MKKRQRWKNNDDIITIRNFFFTSSFQTTAAAFSTFSAGSADAAPRLTPERQGKPRTIVTSRMQ